MQDAGAPSALSVNEARASLAAIDGAGEGTASLEEARGRVDAIEETLYGVDSHYSHYSGTGPRRGGL